MNEEDDSKLIIYCLLWRFLLSWSKSKENIYPKEETTDFTLEYDTLKVGGKKKQMRDFCYTFASLRGK